MVLISELNLVFGPEYCLGPRPKVLGLGVSSTWVSQAQHERKRTMQCKLKHWGQHKRAIQRKPKRWVQCKCKHKREVRHERKHNAQCGRCAMQQNAIANVKQGVVPVIENVREVWERGSGAEHDDKKL